MSVSAYSNESPQDVILRLRDQIRTLNLKCTAQEKKISELTFQQNLRIKNRNDNNIIQTYEKKIVELDSDRDELRKMNSHLLMKVRRLETQIQQKQIAQGLTVEYGACPRPAKKPIAIGINDFGRSSRSRSSSPKPNRSSSPSGVDNSDVYSKLENYKYDIVKLEDSCKRLSKENTELRSLLARKSTSDTMSSLPHPSELPADVAALQTELRSKTTELIYTRSELDSLRSKLNTNTDLYNRSLLSLDALQKQVSDQMYKLDQAEGESLRLRQELQTVGDVRTELMEARARIQSLEQDIVNLCSSPFSGDSKDRLILQNRADENERKLTELRRNFEHIQKRVHAQHAELEGYQRKERALRDEADSAVAENKRLRQESESLRRSNVTLRERLALFSGVVGMSGSEGLGDEALAPGSTSLTREFSENAETRRTQVGSYDIDSTFSRERDGMIDADLLRGGSVPVHELERALTMVRARMDISPSDTTNIQAARSTREVDQLRLALVASEQEQQRLKALLESQQRIASDLAAELDALHRQNATAEGGAKSALEAAVHRAREQSARCRALQAQVTSLTAALAKQRSTDAQPSVAVSSSVPLEGASTTPSQVWQPSFPDKDFEENVSMLSGDDQQYDFAVAQPSSSVPLAVPTVQQVILVGENDSVSESSFAEHIEEGLHGLEVSFKDVCLRPGPVTHLLGLSPAFSTLSSLSNIQSFVRVEFLDADSRESEPGRGLTPLFRPLDFEFAVDEFLLQELERRALSVRLFLQSDRSMPLLAASANVPLEQLLRMGPKLCSAWLPLSLVSPLGDVLGSLCLQLRLSAPLMVSPADPFVQLQQQQQLQGSSGLLATRAQKDHPLFNGLRVCIDTLTFESRAVPFLSSQSTSGGINGYLQLSLPGLGVCVTPVTSLRLDGLTAIHDARELPLLTSPDALDSIRSSAAVIHLFSIENPLAPALLASGKLSLEPLADGAPLQGLYLLVDVSGLPVASVSLNLSLSRPLKLLQEAQQQPSSSTLALDRSFASAIYECLAEPSGLDVRALAVDLLLPQVLLPLLEEVRRRVLGFRDGTGAEELLVSAPARSRAQASLLRVLNALDSSGTATADMFIRELARQGCTLSPMQEQLLQLLPHFVSQEALSTGVPARLLARVSQFQSYEQDVCLMTLSDSVQLMGLSSARFSSGALFGMLAPRSAKACSALEKLRNFVSDVVGVDRLQRVLSSSDANVSLTGFFDLLASVDVRLVQDSSSSSSQSFASTLQSSGLSSTFGASLQSRGKEQHTTILAAAGSPTEAFPGVPSFAISVLGGQLQLPLLNKLDFERKRQGLADISQVTLWLSYAVPGIWQDESLLPCIVSYPMTVRQLPGTSSFVLEPLQQGPSSLVNTHSFAIGDQPTNGLSLRSFLTKAMAPNAIPELADIPFKLSTSKPYPADVISFGENGNKDILRYASPVNVIATGNLNLLDVGGKAGILETIVSTYSGTTHQMDINIKFYNANEIAALY